MKPDLFWIPGPWRGKLAVSTRPRGEDWLEDEVAGWRHEGIEMVASLLEDDEAIQLGLEEEQEAVELQGLRFLSFPIPDRGVPTTARGAITFLTNLVSALDLGTKLAVHCRQGIGRSGLVAAGLLILSGRGAREAVDIVSNARGVVIPETAGQLQWLEHLAAERLAVAS